MIHQVELPTGVRLEYTEQGDPDGVPVLLLHGGTDSRTSWDPVLPHLPDSVRAIAVSQRGHGESARPRDAGYRHEDMAADAAALIEALTLGPAIVVGHSMGAYVAERVAIDRPDLVLGTVLEGAIGPGSENPVLVEVRNEVAGLADPIDPEFAREFQLGTTERALPPGLLDAFAAESLKLPAWLWLEVFDGLLEIDMTAELGSVQSPVLLVWGDRDAFDTRAEQEWLLETLADARLVVYEGTGHAVHWEEPERFAADLADFALAQGRSRTMSSSETSGLSKRALTA
jgi:pimeloyl-ACP methyl ester carboxylesterase